MMAESPILPEWVVGLEVSALNGVFYRDTVLDLCAALRVALAERDRARDLAGNLVIQHHVSLGHAGPSEMCRALWCAAFQQVLTRRPGAPEEALNG